MMDREAVLEALRRIREAWTTGRPEGMADDLDADIRMVQPGFGRTLEGREAAIAGFREFTDSATIHAYQEGEPDLTVRDGAAVATFGWRMDWEMDGERYSEHGHDIYVFSRVDGRWQAIWRLLVPETDPQAVGEAEDTSG